MSSQVAESFPRRLRLTTANDFRLVFNDNFRVGDDCITILVKKEESMPEPRLGFAIAKKQIARAVERNRLKRIFRESFRTNQHRLPPNDMVIMVRKNILTIDNVQLLGSLEKHWNYVIKRCAKS